MTEKKLNQLQQNLLEKKNIMDCLLGVCEKQMHLLTDSSMQIEVFDACMDEQDTYVKELIQLNEEADELYNSLASEKALTEGKYGAQIDQIRELITYITDQTNQLQKKEQTVKQKLDNYFQNERMNFGTGRRTSKAALDYHKSMNRSNVIPPQFMDQKK